MKLFQTFLILCTLGMFAACSTTPNETAQPDVRDPSPPSGMTAEAPPTESSVSDNTYHSAEVGFTITKSSGWSFMNPDLVMARVNQTRLDDKDLEALMKKSKTPLVVIRRNPSDATSYNPNVVVVLVPVPVEGMPLKSVMNSALGVLKHSFSDLTLIDEIKDTEVDGMDSAYSKFKYTVTVNGHPTPVMARIWLVSRGKIIFNIVMTGSQEIPNPAEADFQEMLRSVKISR